VSTWPAGVNAATINCFANWSKRLRMHVPSFYLCKRAKLEVVISESTARLEIGRPHRRQDPRTSFRAVIDRLERGSTPTFGGRRPRKLENDRDARRLSSASNATRTRRSAFGEPKNRSSTSAFGGHRAPALPRSNLVPGGERPFLL